MRIKRVMLWGVLGSVVCAAAAGQDAGRGAPADALCEAFPDLAAEAVDFAEMFASGSDDLDGDELPDDAALRLVREVACNPDAPLPLSAATALAYDANLGLFDGELDTAGLEGFREAIAALMLTNATTEAAVKAALALVEPPYALAADYAQVTCTGGDCLPAAIRGTAEFLDWSVAPRAANEPYAADGDLDGDGVTNLTEYENIEAQGGTLGDFVVAATSAELDGTEPVRSSGGGCFIATAAYGTPFAGQIEVLRTWRDRSLMTNPAGAAFSDVYYRLSPDIADRVAGSDALAALVRIGIAPVVVLLQFDGVGAVAWMAMLGVLALASFARQRRVTSPSRRPRTERGR